MGQHQPWRVNLILGLFVLSLLFAPLAVLFQLDLAHDKLPILARPIVDVLALFAAQPYELIL